MLLALPALRLPAQAAPGSRETPQQGASVRVYLDCQASGCAHDYFVTEIAFVEFTRDRVDADIHLLITQLSTGGGGTQYTLRIVGQRRFAGRVDTLLTGVGADATSDDRRRAVVRMSKLALVRYAAATPAAQQIDISYNAPVSAPNDGSKAKADPWNLWVYRINSNGSFNSESETKSGSISGSVTASRTTEQWKLSFGASFDYNQSSYSFADSTTSTFVQRSSSANLRIVRTLTGNWSAGLNANISHSEYNNQDLSTGAQASIEYNFFPWKEATHRQLVAIYAIGPTYNRYIAETIYLQTSETLAQHQFILAHTTTQPWGSVDVQASFSQYLHDLSKTNLSLGGGLNVRIAKGFSVNVFGSVSSVHDQLFLARGDLSVADILTRQRALATSFSFFGNVGFSYTFGSIFDTIVNPRLNRLSGSGSSSMMMMCCF